MLVPHYQLKGHIDIIKEIELPNNMIERWYEDEDGNRAIVVMKDIRQAKCISVYDRIMVSKLERR